MDINHPDVLRELGAVCARYEEALATNDLDTLKSLFWHSERVVRFGVAENLYGFDDIVSFRKAQAIADVERERKRVVLNTFGDAYGTFSSEDIRPGVGRLGRITQAWVKLPDGWRVVAAHVSIISTNTTGTTA